MVVATEVAALVATEVEAATVTVTETETVAMAATEEEAASEAERVVKNMAAGFLRITEARVEAVIKEAEGPTFRLDLERNFLNFLEVTKKHPRGLAVQSLLEVRSCLNPETPSLSFVFEHIF